MLDEKAIRTFIKAFCYDATYFDRGNKEVIENWTTRVTDFVIGVAKLSFNEALKPRKFEECLKSPDREPVAAVKELGTEETQGE